MAKKQKKPKESQTLFNYTTLTEKIKVALLQDLSNDEYNTSRVDPESWEFFVESQRSGFHKKMLDFDSSLSSIRRDAAFAKFMGVHAHINSFSDTKLPCPDVFRGSVHGEKLNKTYLDRALLRAREYMHAALGQLSLIDVFDKAKHSTGTTVGCAYSNCSPSAKMKGDSLTCTPQAYPLWVLYCLYDTNLVENYQYENPEAKLSAMGAIIPRFIVDGSPATTVPKNSTIDRFIKPEETIPMFLQQGVMDLMSERLFDYFGIDIEHQQEKHKQMAFTASVSRNLATIDWSSASDTVGRHLVKYLLPPDWFAVLDRLRARELIVNGVSIPSGNLFSSMGNAMTFPLETLIFACLAHSAVDELTRKDRSLIPEWNEFKASTISVFGDDCIVPTEAAEIFMQLCESVGFILNKEKSFTDKNTKFRESCGADYYQGRNVRPYFYKGPRSLTKSNLQAFLYSVWNGFLNTAIPAVGSAYCYYFANVLQAVVDELVSLNVPLHVVRDEDPDDSGLKFFGDIKRLACFFSKASFCPIVYDEHGTINYQKLISNRGSTCYTSAPIEYWAVLKHIDRRQETQNRIHITLSKREKVRVKIDTIQNVSKQDRGYVVAKATSVWPF
jgi:hypothetical protein